jgi:hypothetical protein
LSKSNGFDISLTDLVEAIESGEIIAKYQSDKPFPSRLILKFVSGKPIHIVVAQNPVSFECILITTYVPDQNILNPDFKTKKIF